VFVAVTQLVRRTLGVALLVMLWAALRWKGGEELSRVGLMSGRTTAIVLLLVLAGGGCTRRQEGPSEKEAALVAAAGIPEALALEAKRLGKNLRQLQGVDPNGETFLAAGVTVDVRDTRALRTVRRLQQTAGAGYFAFISERNYRIKGAPDSVSLLKTSDPYDALRTMGTNGWNYDISPEMVIARLKAWDARFGLVLHGVGFDWLEARFQRQPDNMLEFAKEVHTFCPDVVDQGSGTVEALARDMARTDTLFLWWD
jgi:hypothetical protein